MNYYLWHLKITQRRLLPKHSFSLSYLTVITNKIKGALHGNGKRQAYHHYLRNQHKQEPLGLLLGSKYAEVAGHRVKGDREL